MCSSDLFPSHDTPRMTGAQAEAISSPAEGLMVYSTDGSGTTITSKGWWGYDGATWVKLN